MKKSIALAAGLLASSSIMASAADLPSRVAKAPPPVVAPVYNWTGFYIGANAGYGFAKTELEVFGVTILEDDDLRGPLAGGQIGYNWQTGNFVFGIEADAQWTGIDNTLNFAGLFTLDQKVSWFGTIRGRIGVAANNWLFYGTAGGAYGNFKADLTDLAGLIGPVGAVYSSSATRWGWTAGGGVEVGFANNWSFKAEYLYIRADDSSNDGGVPIDESIAINVIRGGINYRF